MRKYRVAFKLYDKYDSELFSNDNFLLDQKTNVIKGFWDAVMSLDVGEEKVTIIESDNAYGQRG